MEKTYRIGLWGCGRRTDALVKKPLSDKRIRVTRCYDLDSRRAESAAANYAAKACSLDEMLSAPDVDVLLISLFPAAHPDALIAAAASGKAVYIEKPITTNWDNHRQVLKAMAGSNAYVHVGLMFRHLSVFRTLKKIVSSGRIGEMISMDFNWLSRFEAEDRGNWRCKPETGGELVQHFCHPFDWFRWMGGDFKNVSAMSNHFVDKDIPVEDTWNILVEYASGVLLSFHSSMRNSRCTETGWIEGTEGALEWEWSDHSKIHLYPQTGERRKAIPLEISEPDIDPLTDFLDRYSKGEPPSVSVEDALWSVILALLARDSDANKTVLHFPKNIWKTSGPSLTI